MESLNKCVDFDRYSDQSAIDDSMLCEVGSVVAQALVGALSLSHSGITHNDMHSGNLMYKTNLSRDEISQGAIQYVVGEGGRRLVIPTSCDCRVCVIDFGLSAAKLASGRVIGGNTMDEFNIPGLGGVNTDARTIALDLCCTLPLLVSYLLGEPVECDKKATKSKKKSKSKKNKNTQNAQNAQSKDAPQLSARATQFREFLTDFLKLALSEKVNDIHLWRWFRHDDMLTKVCKELSVEPEEDWGKTLKNDCGKYHILREIALCEHTTCDALTEESVTALLMKHYGAV